MFWKGRRLRCFRSPPSAVVISPPAFPPYYENYRFQRVNRLHHQVGLCWFNPSGSLFLYTGKPEAVYNITCDETRLLVPSTNPRDIMLDPSLSRDGRLAVDR